MKALHRPFGCIKKKKKKRITVGSPWEEVALIIHTQIEQHFEIFFLWFFFPFIHFVFNIYIFTLCFLFSLFEIHCEEEELFHFVLMSCFLKSVVYTSSLWIFVILHNEFFFFFFLGLHLRHMEVPRLGVWSELQSLAYTTAQGNTGSLTHWARPGIKPATPWFLVRFVSAAPQQERP